MQLERILQSQGFGTRKDCRVLIRHRRVTVNGVLCENPFAEYATDGLNFSIDDATWPFQAQATIILHKPADYECSRQPQHHRSIFELIPEPLRARGVQPIGRLDADTTGLLLLTDDGQLNHRLASGKRRVPKVYRVTTRHPLTPESIADLLDGVQLHDEPAPIKAAAAEQIDGHALRLTVTEGKYHQVKRMIAAVGNRVEALHRESFAGLALPADLPTGHWRWLAPEALAQAGQAE
ncbi:MAG: pseudouridine synthase [Azonexus sp.]